jgi:glutamate-1-semialdehyde 2,1-aminomutase
LQAAQALFSAEGERIACIIVEPVVGNMGVWVPRPGFLQGLQALARKHGALFILDEVMTGFRLSPGGAQGLYGLEPDLTCLGKVIGGGLPVGALGGRRDVMQRLAPTGPVYQAGTLSGNPLAVAAGLACLQALDGRAYAQLEETGRALEEGLLALAQKKGLSATLNRVGSMWTLFFAKGPVFDYRTAKTSSTETFGRFFHAMLDAGVYLPPSQFEAAFVSLAMGPAEVAHTLKAAEQAFAAL